MNVPKGLTLIHETEMHSGGNHWESGSKLYIFRIDYDDNSELWMDIANMTADERREMFGLVNESDYPYAIRPGALYTDYSVRLMSDFVIVEETAAYNV